MEEREAFEEWFSMFPELVERDRVIAWEAWQAARSTIAAPAQPSSERDRTLEEAAQFFEGAGNTLLPSGSECAGALRALKGQLPAQESVADDDLLEAIEQEVGMAHGGWDMVSASKLVAAFRKHLRAAPASTAAPVVPEGWQPIATAPTDGTEIIGWTEDAGRVICKWGKHNHVPLYGWIRRIELYGEEVDGFDPVLWMPLAAAPKPDA